MPLTVLIVEDRNEILASLRAVFEAEPRLVFETVASGADAVRRLRRHPFDVLLLGLDLTDGRGFHTLAGLLASHPELPVVVYGSFGNDPDLALEALRLGAQDFVFRDELERADWWRLLNFARERKRHERFAVHAAQYDPRTGLPLTPVLRQQFERAASRAQRSGRELALVAFALDGYTALKDEAGADLADRAVAAMAARLRSRTRKSETLASSLRAV